MCEKTKYRTPNPRIDKCLVRLIDFVNSNPHVKTLACCCGHGKYNLSIVVSYKTNSGWKIKDLCSGVHINRTRRFYKKDKHGYYYIPEVKDD